MNFSSTRFLHMLSQGPLVVKTSFFTIISLACVLHPLFFTLCQFPLYFSRCCCLLGLSRKDRKGRKMAVCIFVYWMNISLIEV